MKILASQFIVISFLAEIINNCILTWILLTFDPEIWPFTLFARNFLDDQIVGQWKVLKSPTSIVIEIITLLRRWAC